MVALCSAASTTLILYLCHTHGLGLKKTLTPPMSVKCKMLKLTCEYLIVGTKNLLRETKMT